MCEYSTGLIPGPTSVPEYVRRCYMTNFGCSDIEPEFVDLYLENVKLLQTLLNTKNDVVIMSGEGMVILWGAIKSTLKPGDRVLAVSSGLFGDGFADMAKICGAEAQIVKGADGDAPTIDQVKAAMDSFKPTVVTMVHCETPAGILNDVSEVGQLCHERGCLFMVDFVSSAAGAEVRVDDWHIDIGMLGTQKALSCLPDLAIGTISEKAWKVIDEINYIGYDSIKQFKNWREKKEFPYTPNWQANAAMNASLKQILNEEGLENVLKRHKDVAEWTRNEIRKMGLKLYPVREELNSPTVTGVYVPEGWTWEKLNKALREKGVVLGGTWGDLSGKIFRIGHMGNQARMENVQLAIAALKEVLA